MAAPLSAPHRLRRKLDAAEPWVIKTVRGAGYMFAGIGDAEGWRKAAFGSAT